MKFCTYLFLFLLMFSCVNEKSKKAHSSKRKSEKNQVKTDRDEVKVILGSIKIKLAPTDQKFEYLRTLISSKNLNEENKSGNSEGQETITYLGQINVHGESFHVFKQIYFIQFAREIHGGSEMIFANKNGASYYELEMSENLPIDMNHGIFRFNTNADTIYMKIEYMSDSDIVFKKVKTQ